MTSGRIVRMCRTRSPTISSSAPLLDRFLHAERKAEVDRAREVLLGAVEAVDGEQLLGPQHAERRSELGTDLVLAAVAARQRHQRGAHPLAEAEHRQQPVVLVVRMRVGLHEGAGARQLAQRELERDGVGALAGGRDAELRRTGPAKRA